MGVGLQPTRRPQFHLVHSGGSSNCSQGREFSEFPKPPSSGHGDTAVLSKIEPRPQLDETLVASGGRRIEWRHYDVTQGVYQGRCVEIRHV